MTQPYPPQAGPPGGYPTGGYPAGGYYPQPPTPQKKRRWPWIVGGIFAFFVLVAACNSVRAGSTTAAPASTVQTTVAAAPTTVDAVAPVAPVAPEPAPEPAPAPQSGPMTSFQDVETLAVGTDITPGQYTTSGAPGGLLQSSCYYQIDKSASGDFGDIVKNGNIGENAKGRVTLKAGQYFSSRGGCTWTKAG